MSSGHSALRPADTSTCCTRLLSRLRLRRVRRRRRHRGYHLDHRARHGQRPGPDDQALASRVPPIARRADRVIAASRASARDIERHLRVPQERIDVIPLGYGGPPRTPQTPEAELRVRLALGDGPIVLNVGAQKLHKNQMRLVGALPQIRGAFPDTRLVLAGAPTPYESELRAEAERLDVGAAVALPGYYPSPISRASTRRPLCSLSHR